jgi:hypothetical protein
MTMRVRELRSATTPVLRARGAQRRSSAGCCRPLLRHRALFGDIGVGREREEDVLRTSHVTVLFGGRPFRMTTVPVLCPCAFAGSSVSSDATLR